MANAPEWFINSTDLSLIAQCLKENPFGFIVLYLIKLFCSSLATAAHLWCLQFYFCGTECKFRTAVFFLNHNIMELMYCLECLPETLNVFIFNSDIYNKVLFFVFGLSWTGRPLLQACICVEQYLAVLHPLIFLRYKDIKYRIAVVVVVWVIAFGYGLHTFNLQTFPDPLLNFVFFTAVTVISFCCVSVLYALKQSHKRISKQTGRYAGSQQTRNVFNTIFLALLIILLTYFSQLLLSFLSIMKIEHFLFYCTILPLISFLNTWSVMITPFLKMYKDCHLKCNVLICRSVE